MAVPKKPAKKPSAAVAKLAKYRAMRDFKKTQEPAGNDAPEQAKGLRYLIQKHAATRLHYDFRLEWEGVLWSWAVTRGPSLDPADKRLAVHTEDHPIEYGDFEGTIPHGEYGGGTVMLWDTGTWEPLPQKNSDIGRDYARGKIHFLLHGERLKGEWILLKMKGRAAQGKHENWLLIKAEDQFAKHGKGNHAIQTHTTSVITKRGFDEIKAGALEWKSGSARKKPAVAKTKTLPAKPAKSASKTTAAKHAAATIAEPIPKNIGLQLATLVEEPPRGKEWLHEIKFDGYRLLVRIEGGHVRMITRNGKDWTAKFQQLADAFASLETGDALIDGEVVVQGADGSMKFSDLQHALTEDDQRNMRFYAFDLLYANGRDIRHEPLRERKKQLRALLPKTHARLHYSEDFAGSGEDVLHHACSIALEGIISKRADRPYTSGRGKDWLKSKCIHEQEFAIGGYTLPSHDGPGIGALLLGYYEDGQFTYAGRVGTGFDNAMSLSLRSKLGKLARETMPFEQYSDQGRRGAAWKKDVRWVKPRLVCQVVFTEWTPEGHLRHPSFQGMREDKKAQDVVREREAKLKDGSAGADKKPRARVAKNAAGESKPEPRLSSTVKQIAKKAAGEIASQSKPMKKSVGKSVSPPAISKGIAKKSAGKSAATTSSKKSGRLQVGGISVSHPERVVFAESNITKGEAAEYYLAVAPFMLPHVAGRPVSLMRCPDGAGAECFFQRHATPGMPDTLEVVDIAAGPEEENYMTLHTADGLVAAVQMGGLELHVWGAEAADVERPDRIVFDLDPDEAVPFVKVKDAARLCRARLKKLGLESFIKTTGGKGLHVVVPFKKGPGWAAVKQFAHAFSALLAEEQPDNFTVNMRKALRKGKIYLDYLRNERSASAVAPYSLRARAGAPVAMPIEWSQLEKLASPAHYTLRNTPAYVQKRKKDPWAEMAKVKQKLPV